MLDKTQLIDVTEDLQFVDTITSTGTIISVTPRDPVLSKDVTITVTPTSATFEGFYYATFDNKYFEARETWQDPKIIRGYGEADLPDYYYALTRYNPDRRQTITVEYDVLATDIATGLPTASVVTQIIYNNWDWAHAILKRLIAKGEV